MKKCLILFLCLFTTDSLASGIASNTNSAPCTNTTLETYSGNSNLAADWQPNEIQLRWYNGNTLLDVQSSANTCVYDDTLTIPQTAPTRTGYTFAGWTVRPEMDFSTIPTNENGLERWAKGSGTGGADGCSYDTNILASQDVDCNSEFDDLQQQEWKARFSFGILYGMNRCSVTNGGTTGQIGTPEESLGTYCWCRVTGFKSTNSDIISAPSAKLSWVYYDDSSGSIVVCNRWCGIRCAYAAYAVSYFRTALFTSAGQ